MFVEKLENNPQKYASTCKSTLAHSIKNCFQKGKNVDLCLFHSTLLIRLFHRHLFSWFKAHNTLLECLCAHPYSQIRCHPIRAEFIFQSFANKND